MFPFRDVCISISILSYLLDTYLEHRQRKKYLDRNPPKELDGIVSIEEYKKSMAYSLDKSNLGFYQSLFNQVIQLFVLYNPVFAIVWGWSGEVIKSFGLEHEVFQSGIFALVYLTISTILSIPWSAYDTFVIEEKHGLNKTTVSTFVTDILKTFALTVLIGFPVLSVILLIVRAGGDYFYIYVWAFVFIFQIFMLVIYPSVIQPLFNKVVPLEPGTIRTAIESLAAKENFPLKNVYTIDGSTRSSHSNAYFYGLFNEKMIVLYDTLIQQVDLQELVAILAHELGHWYHWHLVQTLFVYEVQSFIMFFFYGLMHNNRDLFESFGFDTSENFPVLVGLMLFSYLYAPVSLIVSLLLNVLSRKNEYQADKFAADRGYGKLLGHGLTKISKTNLSGASLNPDWLYSLFNFSHPSLLERLAALDNSKKK